jgi:hypothetical protein
MSARSNPPGVDDLAGWAEVLGEDSDDGLDGVAGSSVDERPNRGDPTDRSGRLSLVALAVALVPLVVAAVRALARDWVPAGDAATIGIRARDVLGGGELPLIGPTASSSLSSGILQNHPGPLFYDVLAVPAALFGDAKGLVVGTVLIEAVAVVGIFVLARRRGGSSLALAAMVMTAVLCWSLGSAALVEPWPPNTLVLPAVCFFLLAWSVMDGDVACLPWLVGVGSFIVQSNMSYGVLVPVVAAAAVAGLVWRGRGAPGAPDTSGAPGAPGRWRPAAWATGAVVVVAWIQPVIEQLTGDGEGNLSRIVRSMGQGGLTLDWRASLQVVATVVALPPWWARPSVDHDFRFGVDGNPLPSAVLAAAALVVVGGLLWWCLRRARRGAESTSATGLTTAIVVVVATLVTANQTPTTPAGTVAYQVRWLWPVAFFVWLAVVAFGLRHLDRDQNQNQNQDRVRILSRPRLSVALIAVTVAVSTLNLAWTNEGTAVEEASMPVASDLVRSIDAADIRGPVLVETNESLWDGYTEAVMFELDRQGVELVVDDEVGDRMLGRARRWDGDNAVALLRISTGDWATLPSPGATVLGRHRGLDQREHDELFLLQTDIEEAFADGELRLNGSGRRAAERNAFESVARRDPDHRVDAGTVTDLRFLNYGRYLRDVLLMIREDLLDAPDDWVPKLERYADLQERWDSQTVAVFLEPIANAEPPGDPGDLGDLDEPDDLGDADDLGASTDPAGTEAQPAGA